MDYSELNSLLIKLDIAETMPQRIDISKNPVQIKNETTNSHYNPSINENYFFNDTQKFTINSNTDKIKSKQPKHSYENVSIDRNMDMANANNLNTNFNFERFNPQRTSITKSQVNDSEKASVEINRNMQSDELLRYNPGNIFDYSQFSETYKNSSRKDVDINKKLSQRENAPNIGSIPANIWDK